MLDLADEKDMALNDPMIEKAAIAQMLDDGRITRNSAAYLEEYGACCRALHGDVVHTSISFAVREKDAAQFPAGNGPSQYGVVHISQRRSSASFSGDHVESLDLHAVAFNGGSVKTQAVPCGSMGAEDLYGLCVELIAKARWTVPDPANDLIKAAHLAMGAAAMAQTTAEHAALNHQGAA